MKGSNTLTSHYGESRNSRADKMSGIGLRWKRICRGSETNKFFKKFMNRKRRMFLKNENNFEKI